MRKGLLENIVFVDEHKRPILMYKDPATGEMWLGVQNDQTFFVIVRKPIARDNNFGICLRIDGKDIGCMLKRTLPESVVCGGSYDTETNERYRLKFAKIVGTDYGEQIDRRIEVMLTRGQEVDDEREKVDSVPTNVHQKRMEDVKFFEQQSAAVVRGSKITANYNPKVFKSTEVICTWVFRYDLEENLKLRFAKIK